MNEAATIVEELSEMDENETEEVVGNALHATLWRILIDPLEVKSHTDSGFELPQATIDAQAYLQYVGKVVSMGPLCFTKSHHFADSDGKLNRPCEVGDWIVYGRHTGVEVYEKVGERGLRRLRVINDDQILCKVDDLDRMQIPLQ